MVANSWSLVGNVFGHLLKHFNHYLKISNHPMDSGSISTIDLVIKTFKLLTQINLVIARKIQSAILYQQTSWLKIFNHQIEWLKFFVVASKKLATTGLQKMNIAFVATRFKATKWSDFQLPLTLLRKHSTLNLTSKLTLF